MSRQRVYVDWWRMRQVRAFPPFHVIAGGWGGAKSRKYVFPEGFCGREKGGGERFNCKTRAGEAQTRDTGINNAARQEREQWKLTLHCSEERSLNKVKVKISWSSDLRHWLSAALDFVKYSFLDHCPADFRNSWQKTLDWRARSAVRPVQGLKWQIWSFILKL